MKTALLLMAALSAPALAQNNGQDWVNFIRQNQVRSGIVWDMPVDSKGRRSSALELEEEGALFQLWTIRQSDAKDFLLDQKVVGAYLPSANIRIETGDPYPLKHRTRADQPFSVEIDVHGLLSGANIPDAAKRVLLEHHLAVYQGEQSSVDPRIATSGTPDSSGYLNQNGTIRLDFNASSLPAGDPTKAIGEEHFVVHSLADNDAPQTQIASDFVQIWPVASGRISGILPGEVIRFRVPEIYLHLDDLYPASTTYLQVYPGAPQLGTTGTKIEGTVLVLDGDTNADRVIPAGDWQSALTRDGQHTMEIVTETPFGTERLAYLSFEVDRVLAVNALIGDAESLDSGVEAEAP